MNLEQTAAEFSTTQWTMVEALRERLHPMRQQAEQRLFEKYWPPVYAWFRRRKLGRVEAAEATQEFFFKVVMGRTLFQRADPQRGSLRSLFLSALRNFTIDRRRASAGHPVTMTDAALDGEEQRLAARSRVTDPGAAFDQRWASVALDEALERCEQHYRLAGRSDYWEAFAARIVRPARHGADPLPFKNLARDFGFTDAEHAAVAVHAVKARCRLFLQQVITESVAKPASAEREIEFVQSLLS